MLHGPPRGLQQQAMLRVHEDGLARRHPEEGSVETRYVVDESRPSGHHLSGGARFGIVELLDVPSVRRHLRDRLAALLQQVPELVGIGGAGESAPRSRRPRIRGPRPRVRAPAPAASRVPSRLVPEARSFLAAHDLGELLELHGELPIALDAKLSEEEQSTRVRSALDQVDEIG